MANKFIDGTKKTASAVGGASSYVINGTKEIASAVGGASSYVINGTKEIATAVTETTKIVALQITKGFNEKLSDSQNDKQPNFEEIAILNFNACLDDLPTFKQAIKNYSKSLNSLDIDLFLEREALIHHMVENPSTYNIYEGRLEDEINPSGLVAKSMDKSDITLYGIARFYGTESTGVLEYYNEIKAQSRIVMDALHKTRTELLKSYTLALHDPTKSIPLRPQTLYVSLPANEEQSIQTTVLCESGETLTKTIPFSSLGGQFNPDITLFEALTAMSTKVVLAAGIPEIDIITRNISIEEANYGEIETNLSQISTQRLEQIRSILNKLLPLRVAFDKINIALSKGNIHQDLRPEAILLLDQYQKLSSNDLSKGTSLLLEQLTQMNHRIEEHCTLVVSQALKQLLNDVESRKQIDNTVKETDQQKPLIVPQYTSNKYIPWCKESIKKSIDVSNHSMPFKSETAPGNLRTQEPLIQEETNPNATWMIIACLLGGTILIAASVALVALSHGATAPIGGAGITLGINLISAAAGSLGTLGLFGFGAAYRVTMYSNDEAPNNSLA